MVIYTADPLVVSVEELRICSCLCCVFMIVRVEVVYLFVLCIQNSTVEPKCHGLQLGKIKVMMLVIVLWVLHQER